MSPVFLLGREFSTVWLISVFEPVRRFPWIDSPWRTRWTDGRGERKEHHRRRLLFLWNFIDTLSEQVQDSNHSSSLFPKMHTEAWNTEPCVKFGHVILDAAIDSIMGVHLKLRGVKKTFYVSQGWCRCTWNDPVFTGVILRLVCEFPHELLVSFPPGEDANGMLTKKKDRSNSMGRMRFAEEILVFTAWNAARIHSTDGIIHPYQIASRDLSSVNSFEFEFRKSEATENWSWYKKSWEAAFYSEGAQLRFNSAHLYRFLIRISHIRFASHNLIWIVLWIHRTAIVTCFSAEEKFFHISSNLLIWTTALTPLMKFPLTKAANALAGRLCGMDFGAGVPDSLKANRRNDWERVHYANASAIWSARGGVGLSPSWRWMFVINN